MADDLRIRGLVELIAKISGLSQGSKELGELGKGAKETADVIERRLNKEFSDLKTRAEKAKTGLRELADANKSVGRETQRSSDAVDKLTRRLIGLVSIGALFRTVKSGLIEFANFERQLNAISFQLDGLGLSVDDNLPKIKDFIVAIEAATGVQRGEVARGFQKLLGLTEDVAAAYTLTQTAAGAAETGVVEFSNAVLAFGSILQGEVLEPTKSLGINTNKLTGEIKSGSEVIAEATERYGEFAGTMDDTQADLGRAAAAWSRLKQGVGGVVAGLINLIQDGKEATDVIVFGLADGVNVLIKALGRTSDVLRAFGDIDLRKLLTGDISGAFDAVTSAVSDAVEKNLKDLDDAKERFGQRWSQIGERSRKAFTDSFDEGLRKAQELADLREQEKRRRQAAKDAEDAQKAADRRAKFEADAEARLLQQRIQLAEEGSQERLRLELEALELAKQRSLELAHELGAETADIEEFYRLARLAAIEDHLEQEREMRQESEKEMFEWLREQTEEFNEERQDEWEAQLQAERDTWENFQREITNITSKFGVARTASEKAESLIRLANAAAEAEGKKQQALAIATFGLAVASSFFGESKTLAIATAVIDTLVAVNKTLASVPWPLNVIAAAAVAAQGFANVQKIRSTDSSGGSIGVSLGAGGAASAGEGFTSGRIVETTYGQQAPTPAPVEETQGVVINAGVVIADDRSIRKFMRRANRIADQDRRARAL